MSVDKFGRTSKTRGNVGIKGPKGPQEEKGHGFNLTESGDYDMQLHKIINCQKPETYHDVTNKMYVDEKVMQLVLNINTKLQSIENRLNDIEKVKQLVLSKLQHIEERFINDGRSKQLEIAIRKKIAKS